MSDTTDWSQDNWPTGFMVVQSNRMENLCDVYVQWLQRYPMAPLSNETLLTQSNGIAQWLKQTLAQDDNTATGSHGCGIAAGIHSQLPAQFVWRCYCALLPNLSNQSVYDKKALTWRFYRLLGTWDLAQLAPLLTHYVSADALPRDRLGLAKQLADLYDQYQVFRPDWLNAWQQGQDTITKGQSKPQPLQQEQLWQANIWRVLSDDINQQDNFFGWSPDSRTQLHQRFLQACDQHKQQNTIPQDLPARIVVFGLSNLPIATLEVLKAIAPFCQVLLFVMNPSQYYWGDLVTGKELFKQAYKRQSKKPHNLPQQLSGSQPLPDSQSPQPLTIEQNYGNPLLAAWGKQGRDFLHLCDEQDLPSAYQHYFSNLAQGKIDLFDTARNSHKTNNLLTCIQDDILQLRTPTERAQLQQPLASNDASLQFISAHSIQREVEILQDHLLADFATYNAPQAAHETVDTTPLQAKNILVMVPDIVAYAPHIDAVFGRHKKTTHGEFDSRYLPYHITDTGERYANPLLGAYETLLNLPLERLTSSQGLALLEIPMCRERFGIAEADFNLIKRWVQGSNIRWALNEQHRLNLGVPSQGQHNTWQFGIDRLLLGYIKGDSEPWQGITPYAEVSGLNGELLGKLNHFVNQLSQWQQTLQESHTPSDWVTILLDLWHAFFAPSTEQESLFIRINEHLQQWQATTQQALSDKLLIPVNLVSNELFEQLEQTNLSSHFITGAINFATLMPMRAVPFRQIWLLGMNDSDYPRQRPYNDFDLIAKDYRPGDRSRREDDRYLFLEALLSAREKLVISWHGRNIRDNTKQPPSVLVSQLQDYLDKGWPDQQLNQKLTRHYPLQAFSSEYFRQDRDLFTYAHEWHIGEGQATLAIRKANAPLPPWQPQRPITASDLSQFLKSPVEALYKQRFNISKPFADEAIATSETFVIEGLQSWRMANDMIANQIDPNANDTETNQHLQSIFAHWQNTGQLLTGDAGQLQTQKLQEKLLNMFTAYTEKTAPYTGSSQTQNEPSTHIYSAQHQVEQQTITIDIALPSLLLNAQPAPDISQHPHQQWLLQAQNTSSNKNIKYANICHAWVCHLAAHLYSQNPVETTIFSPAGQVKLCPLDVSSAESYFQQLLAIWQQAMHQPLPIALHLGQVFVAEALSATPNPEALSDKLANALANDINDYRCWFWQRHFQHLDDLDLNHTQALAAAMYQPMLEHAEVIA